VHHSKKGMLGRCGQLPSILRILRTSVLTAVLQVRATCASCVSRYEAFIPALDVKIKESKKGLV